MAPGAGSLFNRMDFEDLGLAAPGVERRMLGEKLKLEWKYGQRKKTPQAFILGNADYLNAITTLAATRKATMAGALGQAAFRPANRVSRYDS